MADNNSSEEIERSDSRQAGRLEPVAQLPFPDRWEFDVRAGSDSGEAVFEYERSSHPEFDSKRLAEDNSIKIQNSGRTYNVKVPALNKDIWTDDIWRVTGILEECYHCGLGQFGDHEGDCETLFELVERQIETNRMENLLIDVDNVGEKLAERIAERFDSVYDLKDAPDKDLLQIKSVGEGIADNVREVARQDSKK